MSILIILEKVFFLFLMITGGIVAKKFGLIGDKSEKTLSRLLISFFWPALIFFQITKKITTQVLRDNLGLPLLAVITCLSGLGLGLFICRIFKIQGTDKKIFLYNSLINNFVFMALPFVLLVLPEKDQPLLFVHNLGMIVMIWTVGIIIFKGSTSWKTLLKDLFNPGLVVTLGSCLLVFFNLHTYVPKLLLDISESFGNAAFPMSMIIVGAQIYTTGRKVVRFDSWNLLILTTRMVLVPGLLFFLALALKIWLHATSETLFIFMLVNIMPVSLNSVSFSIRFNIDPRRAAQAVAMTHVAGLLTMPFFLYLITTTFAIG